MEEEISQVWRQIGILYHQMSRSANLLDEIHSQTSKYVNNSLGLYFLDHSSHITHKIAMYNNILQDYIHNIDLWFHFRYNVLNGW